MDDADEEPAKVGRFLLGGVGASPTGAARRLKSAKDVVVGHALTILPGSHGHMRNGCHDFPASSVWQSVRGDASRNCAVRA